MAESLLLTLGRADAFAGRTVIDGQRLSPVVTDLRPTTWLVDLDEPGLPLQELSVAMGKTSGTRRSAFYDSFTARKAEAAFELGITALVSLTSSVDNLAATLFGDVRQSTFTPAEGISRGELRRLSSLTGREVEVLKQLSGGRPVRAISAALDITAHTVSAHKRRIFEKLRVRSDAEAVAIAMQAGLVDDGYRAVTGD